MNLELITIGTELLLGFTVDTNGADIARVLGAEGVRIVRRTTVADRGAEIRDAVREALGRSGAVLTTGGLGPTRDDVTKRVVAELFGMPLEFDQSVWNDLVARFSRAGRTPSPSNRTQAEVPRGATVLRNRWGTAPGLWLEGPAGLVVMLPGVPGEMRRLVEHEVAPRLGARGRGTVIRSRVLRTTGIPESTLADRLGEIERDIAPLTLAYLPGTEGVDLRLDAWDLPADEADRRLQAGATLLRERAGQFIYGEGSEDLAALVLERARGLRVRLGTAESCTGGLVGARLTEVPGSSDVYAGGVVCYGNELKSGLLGVEPALMEAHGAVSEPVARAMAVGSLSALRVDLAVAVTGIAGPGGGSEAKPVGTVWLAVADEQAVVTQHIRFPGERHDVRARAAQAALALLDRRLREWPLPH